MCSQGNIFRQVKKFFGDMAIQVLDSIREKPEETLNNFLDDLKMHCERHLKIKHEQERQWRELCEKNFYKSLDHRAFYFKQGEKKSTNTKAFFADIKQRYDKRELEITPESIKKGGSLNSIYYNSYTMLPPEDFHMNAIADDEIAKLTPEQINKYAKKLPQFQLRLDNKEAFEDAYKLVLYHIINGHSSQPEKEKSRMMLNDLMKNFIDFDAKSLPIDEIAEYSEEDLKIIMSEDFILKRMNYIDLDFHAAWEKIKAESNSEDMNDEKGTKSKAIRPTKDSRGGHNRKMEGNKVPYILDRGLAHLTHEGEGMDFFLGKDKDIEEAMFLPIKTNKSNILYGDANFYSFFMHFYCLYERIIKAKSLANINIETEIKGKTNLEPKYVDIWKKSQEIFRKEQYEEIYLKGLYSLLSNSIDTARYEDFCRCCLGPQGYLLFSIDKLINSVSIVK